MDIIFLLDQIDVVAQKILLENPKKVILFNGEMGVGKTTLIKSLAKHLGVNDTTNSPTFSIVNEYHLPNNQYIYHFDFYRIKKESEAIDLGIDEYLYSGNWCFMEWSENISTLIPEEHSVIKIELLPDGKRKLLLI